MSLSNWLSMQKIGLPLLGMAGYFFIFPVLSSMVIPSLGFMGTFAQAGAFAAFFALILYLGKFFGIPTMGGKGIIKATLIMTVIYAFLFGPMSGILTPILSFAGGMVQYLVVFIFFYVGIEISKYFVKSI